jgi:hypothetical protein
MNCRGYTVLRIWAMVGWLGVKSNKGTPANFQKQKSGGFCITQYQHWPYKLHITLNTMKIGQQEKWFTWTCDCMLLLLIACYCCCFSPWSNAESKFCSKNLPFCVYFNVHSFSAVLSQRGDLSCVPIFFTWLKIWWYFPHRLIFLNSENTY